MANIDCTPASKRGSRFIDLTGQVFSRLTVLKEAPKEGKRTKWACLCTCGKTAIVTTSSLKSGKTKSCGCLCSETARERQLKHGQGGKYKQKNSKTAEYRTWLNIRNRCHNSNHPDFKDYGERGIRVCDEWLNDFQAFYDHIGIRPSSKHSIDRIDNSKGYEKGNVRWATTFEQAQNTRANRYLTFDGQTKTITQWSRDLKLNRRTLSDRLEADWCIDCAFNLPTAPIGYRQNYTCTHKPSQK